ncbi:MAG: MEKHLA domain-containing protein [Sulfuricellaceae bacterium]|jgi:hypothetical protein
MSDEPWLAPQAVIRATQVLDSFERLLGWPLIPRQGNPAADARALFDAPFPVLAHGTQADPVLDYGNRAALALWEMDWPRFTTTPSRLTAEPDSRAAREKILQTAAQQGYVAHYSGVRISATGRRFRVEELILWRVADGDGKRAGLAATFPRWEFLQP